MCRIYERFLKKSKDSFFDCLLLTLRGLCLLLSYGSTNEHPVGYWFNKLGIDLGLTCFRFLGSSGIATEEGRAKMDKENLFFMDLGGLTCEDPSERGNICELDVS